MLIPGAEVVEELSLHKAWHVFLDWVSIGNISPLNTVMIHGGCDVPRIAHNVDHPFIAVVEVFMTFQNAGARKTSKNLIRKKVNLRNAGFNVGKGYRVFLIEQIANEKTCPSISRARV